MPMRRLVLLATTVTSLLSTLAAAQEPVRADTVVQDTAYRLPTITVTRTSEPIDRAPMAVDVLDARALRRGQPTVGIEEALSNLPGVFVANRFNFSLDQRLSIRGFGSRANFGLRGVKVMLDGVPQTLPDGQSQLTNVDFGVVDRVEVLRGSSSSLYGNAAGGVIDMRSEAAGTEPFGQRVRFEYGGFGSDKWQSVTSARRGPVSGTFSLSRFTTTNFRQQGAADIRQLNAGLEYLFSGNTSLQFRLSAGNNPRAENPGALTRAEYLANRDSAAATNIRRRADKDVQQQQASLALRRADDAGNEYSVIVFGLLRDLANPLATPPAGVPATSPVGTYVAIDRQVGGIRLSGSRRLGSASLAPRLTAGVDMQRMRDDRVNFVAVSGVPTDSTLIDQREKVGEIGPFAQLMWNPTPRLLLSGGGRYDRITFDVDDHKLTDGADNSGNRTMESVNGNIGASYLVADAFTPYVNLSTSFETPTTTELVNSPTDAGGFNAELDPQRAVNLEVGARGQVGRYVSYSAAAFRTRVNDAIIQYREVGGRAFFQNAGQTHNNGIELGVSVQPVSGLRLFGSYTFADYTFGEYRIVNGATVDTLDGNRLAGVPRHFTRIGLRSEPGYGFALDIDHTLSSFLFADDANTLDVEGYGNGVTNLRVSWIGNVGSASVSPFVGVNNLWDKDYIGSVTINGTFGRVLEPAVGRFLYLGAEIGYRTGS
jgi:iron complex outermembrane recepter protein